MRGDACNVAFLMCTATCTKYSSKKRQYLVNIEAETETTETKDLTKKKRFSRHLEVIYQGHQTASLGKYLFGGE